MAILGKDNIIEVVRMQKAPYWKIFESEQKKQNGTPVANADWDNDNIGVEASLDDLRKTIERLTAGTYILTAFKSNSTNKASVDTRIEIQSSDAAARSHAISGMETGTSKFLVPGIGEVTPENFDEVITKKFKALQAEEAERQRIKNLEEENKRLKAEAREADSGVNKGLLAIGAIMWPQLKNTPVGREISGMMGTVMAAANKAAGASDQNATEDTEAEVTGSNISGTGNTEQRLESALEKLAKDNPDIVAHLELLARTKEENPEMYNQGLDFLKSTL